MQWNQPFESYGLQSYPKTASPAFTQIVGEGDVTAVTFLDGSVQFYFIPTIRQNQLPYPCTVKNPYGSLFPNPTNAEVWFVRSITNPQQSVNIPVPPLFNIQLPNTFGDCPPYSPPNYYMNTNPATYHEYTQKFHNDAWTSTTDIHYFYPSLRRAKYLQYCSETQTDPFQQNNNLGQNGKLNRPCLCGPSSSLKEQNSNNAECDCYPKVQIKSSHSCMSVDSESETERRKSIKFKKTSAKHKNTSKRDHIRFCECDQVRKSTSNKFVTTYADQATEDVAKDGQGTQTEMSKSTNKSDIKVEKPKPKQKARNSKARNPIIKLSSSSESCPFCDYCTCSTSKTD